MMTIFARDRCLNVTSNFGCYNFAKGAAMDGLKGLKPLP